MTTKEKAESILDKIYKVDGSSFYLAREYALICVDEIINSYETMANVEYEDGSYLKYWNEVKKEIKTQ